MKSIATRNPQIGSGAYCVRGTGIRILILVERYRAGEPIRELAEDYSLPYATVRQAISWHLGTFKRYKNVPYATGGNEVTV